jgi:hypothetical protein
MTDDTSTSSSEEDTSTNSDGSEPAIDEQSTGLVAAMARNPTPMPGAETSGTEFSTAVDTEATQLDVSSTASAEPSRGIAPGYEQSGAATEAIQPPLYHEAHSSAPEYIYSQPGVASGLYAPDASASYSAQPGQILPGQPGGSASATKRRHTFLWIMLVALVILLIGGGSVFAYVASQANAPAPNSTLQTYCQGVKTGNAQQIYNLLSQQAKTHTSLDDLTHTFSALNQLSSLGMKYSDCTFSNVRVSGSLAVATVSLTLSMTLQGQTMSIATPSLVSLVLENGQWKIDFSTITQPQPNINLPSLLTPTTSSN